MSRVFQRVDGRAGRVYRLKPPLVPEACDLPSVTTILGGGLPKPAIAAWNSKMVAEAAVHDQAAWADLEPDEAVAWLKQAPGRNMRKAGRRGTSIHTAAELVLQGAEPGSSIYAQHVARWRDDWVDQVVAVEQVCVHVTHRWCGTADAIITDRQGSRWLVDWKTGKGVYPDYAMQLAAYANATHWVIDPAGDAHLEQPPHIDRLAILHLTEAGITVHEPDSSIADLWVTFRAAHRIWQDLRTHRLAHVAEPPRPTCDEYLQHLVARCRHAQQHDRRFAARLSAAWPAGYPRLKDGGLTMRQLRHADQLITALKRDLDVPFGPSPTWKTPTQQNIQKGTAA